MITALLVIGTLAGVGCGLWGGKNEHFTRSEGWVYLTVAGWGTALLMTVFLCVMVVLHATVGVDIAEYNSDRDTISRSRESGDPAERATALELVAKWNRMISRCRWWDETIFDDNCPDAIGALELLE